MRPYVLVALPCYNEGQNLKKLMHSFESLNELYGGVFSTRVLVIDDCSSDDTAAVLEELKSRGLQLDWEVHRHEKNKGLTGGINTAFEKFYQNSTSENPALGYALMDGDNSHSPFFLVDMVEKLAQGYDVTIASRYQKGARICGVVWWRQILSLGVACLFKTLRNIPGVWDYSCGYRVYSPRIIREVKKSFPRDVVYEKSFASMVESLVRCHQAGAICTEVPFLLRYDFKLGESKMQFKKTILGTLKILATLRRS